MKLLCKIICFFGLLFCINAEGLMAQGDGPRSFLLSPKGVTGINAKWLSLNQNLIPAGTAMVPGADISVDVFPITLFHTFSLAGQQAQVYAMLNPGSATARAKIGPPIGPIPVNQLSANGLSDGLIGFKVGLKGAPALSVIDFMKSPMQFSLFADIRYWYSGSYSSDKLFNLGTNRATFQIGLPMAIPLNKKRNNATWLEISPSLKFFADNNDPARGSFAKKVEQAPLLVIENHISHNLTPKFWGTLGLRFQQGGRTTVDGVKEDNNMSIIGGGFGAGYQILTPVSLVADYGAVLISDQAKGTMFRISLIVAYANLKKK